MELQIERTIEVDNIKMERYRRATHDSPAEGGGCEDYRAMWADTVTKYKDGKKVSETVYTPLTEFEIDLFEDQIIEWINDHYEEDEPDYD